MAGKGEYWQQFWQRRWSRRRVLKGAALGGAGLAAAALVGCAAEEKPTATPAAPATTPTAAGATPTAAVATPTPEAKLVPKRGGTLSATESAEPSTLDFFKIASYPNADYASAWYSRLYMYKPARKGMEFNKLELTPDLAASFEASGDLTTYTFKLQPNAVWQNAPPVNGRKVTAEDVKLAYERFNSDWNPQAPILRATVDRVETPDEKTVVFKLKGPNAWFVNQVSHDMNMFYMLPCKEIVEGKFDPLKQVVGSGPFIFEKWEPNVIIQMRRNPDYYLKGLDGQPLPYVEKADSFILKDQATRIAQFRAGKIDILSSTPIVETRDIRDLQRTNPNIQVDSWIRLGIVHGVGFQSVFPEHEFYDPKNPFNDVRARRAVSLALDRDGLLKVASEGEGLWNSALSSGFTNYWLDPKGQGLGELAKWYKYNPQEAKQLLAAAGYPDGTSEVPMRGSATSAGSGTGRILFEAVQKMLADIGVRAKITLEDHQAVYIVKTWRGKYTGLMNFGTGAKGVVFEFLHDTYATTGLQHGGVLDPKVDDLILGKLRKAVKFEERYDIVKEIQLYLADKMYIVPGVNTPEYQAAHPWVKNWMVQSWFDDWADAYQYAWLEGKSA